MHVLPRYNPWWSRWLLHVPVVREVVTWNLVPCCASGEPGGRVSGGGSWRPVRRADGLALTQSAGLVVADTKLDLAISPLVDFLARAAHLWDAEGAFGQLQNQAYGYLWPMGPFHALGIQHGPARLGGPTPVDGARAVRRVRRDGPARRGTGVRSDLACIVAGFAFALSPRMLTVLGPISIEVWPSARRRGCCCPSCSEPSRLTGVRRRWPPAVAMVGASTAATFAVLPLGVIWLLTREPGPRRRSMMLWWPLFTVLGTLWWLVPCSCSGPTARPSSTSSRPRADDLSHDAADALRGTSNWVAYIDPAVAPDVT